MNPLRLVFVEPKGGGKIQDGVTVTPTKEEQTVEPDPGFDGLGAVAVEAIPDAYQDVTGVNAGAEDIRVGRVGIDAQGNLLDGEMLPRKPEQEKSVIPMKQAQTVSPDPGYSLSAVNVAKIPDAYQDVSFVDNEAADIRVGKTGVSATGGRLDGQMLPQKPEQSKTVTPIESSQLIEPDAGYALSAVEVDAIPSEYADVSGVTADADKVKSGYVFVDSEGVETQGTNTDDADTSDGTMSASQLEDGEVGYSRGQRIVGTKPIRTADVEISDLSPVPIPAGSYDGTASAKIDDAEAAKIIPANIKKDVEILGQVGSYEGADTLGQYFDNTLTHVEHGSVTSLLASFFEGKTALQYVEFVNLTTIGNRAFFVCADLVSVIAPNVTTIGDSAFQGCTSLTEADFPNATSFGNNAFQNCTSLTSADFPNVTSVAESTFLGCTSLTSADFPNATNIPRDTFYGCTNLVDVNIQNAVYVEAASVYNHGSFAMCTSLQSITLPACAEIRGRQYAGAFLGCTSLNRVDVGVVCKIYQKAFSDCRNLAVLILRGDSVSVLDNASQWYSAFFGTPFAQNGTGGTIYIPESLYSHLGDGTALDYKAATNWSVIDAYGTITWAKIEGSPYEVTT